LDFEEDEGDKVVGNWKWCHNLSGYELKICKGTTLAQWLSKEEAMGVWLWCQLYNEEEESGECAWKEKKVDWDARWTHHLL